MHTLISQVFPLFHFWKQSWNTTFVMSISSFITFFQSRKSSQIFLILKVFWVWRTRKRQKGRDQVCKVGGEEQLSSIWPLGRLNLCLDVVGIDPCFVTYYDPRQKMWIFFYTFKQFLTSVHAMSFLVVYHQAWYTFRGNAEYLKFSCQNFITWSN